jgi:hypothetical protein
MARKGIQLCYPFEEKRLAKWSPPFIVQPKLDGDRCRALIKSKVVTLLSSEENIITSVPHINLALSQMNLPDCELDGELYTHGMNHQEIHGIASRTVNLHSRMEDLEFHVFDVINSEYQLARLAYLAMASEEFKNRPIKMVDCYLTYNLEDVLRAYDKILEEGYEGIIVRNHEANYVRKRSTQIMKFKPKKDDYYTICGYSCEMDRYKNHKFDRLGRFICAGGETTPSFIGNYPPELAPPHGFFAVSGRRKGTTNLVEDQIALWKDREALVFKVIHIQYQHLTPGRNVPRFPVFVDIIEFTQANLNE